MLVACNECNAMISDKAFACPKCGCPVNITKPIPQKKKERMRLPNGFGQISEIKDKPLRNRFRAMVTVGKTSTGKPICRILKPQGYFKTYNEAYAALVEYNKNPYDLNDDIRMFELYERWSNQYFKTLKSESSQRTIICAWNYCNLVYNMRVKDVRARHIKACMDDGVAVFDGVERKASANTKTRIKSMFNLMFDYALEYELVDRNYARTFNISQDVINERESTVNSHMIFKNEEIQLLWDNLDVNYVDVILIQCYGGWRPQELGLIKTENVYLDKGYMIGGMKTKAGTNRVVPIHPKIRSLIEKRHNEAIASNSEYLITCSDGQSRASSNYLTYDKYHKRFKKICMLLGLDSKHRAHDGRKHFITAAKTAEMDEYAIKYIVGHQIDDVTEKHYTERNIEWLIEEMKKIK